MARRESRPPVGRPPTAAQPASPREWSDATWTVRIVPADADGWAAEVRRRSDTEPLLHAPWDFRGDTLEPRPLDAAAVHGLVRTAQAHLDRQERQRQAHLHQRLAVSLDGQHFTLSLDIEADEYEPQATLTVFDEAGEQLARSRVSPDFRLTAASARAWLQAQGSED